MRGMMLILLNLLLPYLLYGLWRYALKTWLDRDDDGMIDLTPNKHRWPWFKLALIGLALLVVSLICTRIFLGGEAVEWSPANPAQSIDF